MTQIILVMGRCPYCNASVSTTDTLSSNTFGADFYSDGRVAGSCIPDDDWLQICSECNKFVWKDEVIKASTSKIPPSKNSKYAELRYANLKDHIRALDEADISNSSKEYYIRMQIRWKFNDRARRGLSSVYETFVSEKEKEIYEDNLKKLLKMNRDKQQNIGSTKNTDGEDEDEDEDGNDINDLRIMQAEIMRELGQFDKCIEVLNKVTDDTMWKNQLLNACQEENQNILKFDTEEPEEVNGLFRE